MKLSQEQLEFFHREGWLFLPELFSPEEVDLLAREAIGIYDASRPEVWREKSGAPRTAFAAHLYNEAFRILGAHPRMIDPVEQLFGEQVYMHQFKINAKSAFTGDVWQWHQDYGTWKRDDGMPEPRAMNIAIFLDEVMPINGPLMLVPQSQNAGDLKASHDLATTSYPLWTLDEETVTRLVKEGVIVAPTGKPGGMLMFHGNLVHGSAGNITPYPRKIVYLTLNAVSNYIRTPTRPDFIAHRDFTPIQTVADDALLRLPRAERPAAEWLRRRFPDAAQRAVLHGVVRCRAGVVTNSGASCGPDVSRSSTPQGAACCIAPGTRLPHQISSPAVLASASASRNSRSACSQNSRSRPAGRPCSSQISRARFRISFSSGRASARARCFSSTDRAKMRWIVSRSVTQRARLRYLSALARRSPTICFRFIARSVRIRRLAAEIVHCARGEHARE